MEKLVYGKLAVWKQIITNLKLQRPGLGKLRELHISLTALGEHEYVQLHPPSILDPLLRRPMNVEERKEALREKQKATAANERELGKAKQLIATRVEATNPQIESVSARQAEVMLVFLRSALGDAFKELILDETNTKLPIKLTEVDCDIFPKDLPEVCPVFCFSSRM